MASLRNVLKEKSNKYYKSLAQLEEKAKELLPHIFATFPEYTDHGWNHSSAVEENLDWLLTDNVKRKMSSAELFCLLIAAWFHDVGMIGEVGDERDDQRKKEIRQTHNLRSRSFIINNRTELGLSTIEAATIGDICMAHRTIDIAKELPTDRIIGNEKVRLQFLGACLRLADGCHMTYDRASALVAKTIKPKEVSKFHFDRHASVGGVGIDDSGAVIQISGIVMSQDGERVLNELGEEIKQEVKRLRHILQPNDVPVKAVDLDIVWLDEVGEKTHTMVMAEECMPRLLVMSGPDEGKAYLVEKDNVRIGRDTKSDILIHRSDLYASRQHAQLYLENDECFLEDVGSMNGTILSGRLIDKHVQVKLQDGDTFRIGKTFLLFKAKLSLNE
ncbi:FHA domain-containing protein [Chloroflexota bacterium]